LNLGMTHIVREVDRPASSKFPQSSSKYLFYYVLFK
jgi:hypothetical protein